MEPSVLQGQAANSPTTTDFRVAVTTELRRLGLTDMTGTVASQLHGRNVLQAVLEQAVPVLRQIAMRLVPRDSRMGSAAEFGLRDHGAYRDLELALRDLAEYFGKPYSPDEPTDEPELTEAMQALRRIVCSADASSLYASKAILDVPVPPITLSELIADLLALDVAYVRGCRSTRHFSATYFQQQLLEALSKIS